MTQEFRFHVTPTVGNFPLLTSTKQSQGKSANGKLRFVTVPAAGCPRRILEKMADATTSAVVLRFFVPGVTVVTKML